MAPADRQVSLSFDHGILERKSPILPTTFVRKEHSFAWADPQVPIWNGFHVTGVHTEAQMNYSQPQLSKYFSENLDTKIVFI